VRVWLAAGEIGAAAHCDARERDLGPLEVRGGHAIVPLASRLTTIRLVRSSIASTAVAPGRASTAPGATFGGE
jgi:hypothetical protein